MSEVTVHINHDDYGYTLGIYVFKHNYDQSREFLESLDQPIKVKRFGDGPITEALKPTIFLEGKFGKEFLQAFANALHQKGIRPKAEPVLENEVSSIKYHLEDMRTLVFERRTIDELKREIRELKKERGGSPGPSKHS